jgi:tetratricopeptide (TPR) repeat protein
MGKKVEAKLSYEKALALNPDHYLTRQRLVFLTKSTDEKALEELTKSIAAFPDSPEPFKQRGYFRLNHKDPSGAKDDFLQALTLTSTDSQLWFYLAITWVSLKNFRESEIAFGKALQLDSRNTEYLLHRGQSRFKMNEFQLALADFTLMTFYDPDDARGYYHKGITLHRISGPKAACQDLTKAKDLGMSEGKKVWDKLCKPV